MKSKQEPHVFINDPDVLEEVYNSAEFSYHEEEGCYGADEKVPWTEAVEAGGSPCGRCCVSFDLVERGDGGSNPGCSVEDWKETVERLGVPRGEVEGRQKKLNDYRKWWPR